MSSGGPIELLLPDVDIWLRAYSRQDPDPLVVHAFSRHVLARGVILVGLVRQALLARTRDSRQFARLGRQTPPSPLPQRQFNSLQDDIVDFAPLPKGRLTERLV